MCSVNTATCFHCFTNHPKFGDTVAFNQALCGLYSAGLGSGQVETAYAVAASTEAVQPAASTPVNNTQPVPPEMSATARNPEQCSANLKKPSVVITGAALGLPGTEHIFDDANIGRILQGEQFIDVDPHTRTSRHARQTHHPSGEERARRPNLKPSTVLTT